MTLVIILLDNLWKERNKACFEANPPPNLEVPFSVKTQRKEILSLKNLKEAQEINSKKRKDFPFRVFNEVRDWYDNVFLVWKSKRGKKGIFNALATVNGLPKLLHFNNRKNSFNEQSRLVGLHKKFSPKNEPTNWRNKHSFPQ